MAPPAPKQQASVKHVILIVVGFFALLFLAFSVLGWLTGGTSSASREAGERYAEQTLEIARELGSGTSPDPEGLCTLQAKLTQSQGASGVAAGELDEPAFVEGCTAVLRNG
jgi:hypothetical protein